MLSAFAHPRMSTGSQKQLRGHSFTHSCQVIGDIGDTGDVGDGIGETGPGGSGGDTKDGGSVVCLN